MQLFSSRLQAPIDGIEHLTTHVLDDHHVILEQGPYPAASRARARPSHQSIKRGAVLKVQKRTRHGELLTGKHPQTRRQIPPVHPALDVHRLESAGHLSEQIQLEVETTLTLQRIERLPRRLPSLEQRKDRECHCDDGGSSRHHIDPINEAQGTITASSEHAARLRTQERAPAPGSGPRWGARFFWCGTRRRSSASISPPARTVRVDTGRLAQKVKGSAMATRKTYWQKEAWERERSSKRYQDFRRRVLARLGDVCWICGHPGATDLDHVTPLAVRPGLMYDESNARVAHGSRGCPECPTKQNGARRCCNQERNRGLAATRRGGASATIPAQKPATTVVREW
jgi:5-methylcytosine-specific restriction endonuclease McrA